jgi:hypothetical protein
LEPVWSETSASGINVIEINIVVSSSDSWVFDTRSMIHTCKSLQSLNLTRRFAMGELDVRVANGAKVAAKQSTLSTCRYPQD